MLLSRCNFNVQAPARSCLQHPALSVPSAHGRRHASVRLAHARVVAAAPAAAVAGATGQNEGSRCEVHHVHCRLPLRAVALGDNSTYVIAFENGDTAWSAGLSAGLCKTLKAAGRDITSVALGRNQGSDTYATSENPGDVYFVSRNGGATTYMGPQCASGLRKMWNTGEGDKRVVKVSFAPDKGWFVLKRGQGTTRLGLPKSLNDHYDDYFDKYDGVQQLSVGHNGEWFVRLGSGWAWNGVHPTLDMLLKQDVSSSMTGAVQWVELGPDGTWVALFDKYTAWYGNHALTKALLSCK